MQKTILVIFLCLFILETSKAQDSTQQEFVNQFSSTIVYGLKHNNVDTLKSVYPSLQDIKDFLKLNAISDMPEEDWNEMVAERAEDLELYVEDVSELINEGRELGFDWKKTKLKNLSFEVETEVGEVEIETETGESEGKEIQLDLYYITILISDGEQHLTINIDEGIVLGHSIKILEFSEWDF